MAKSLISDTKCKYEAYDKNEVDTLLASKANSSALTDYKLKGDFAVISGTYDSTQAPLAYHINYPTGFNKNNCVVISYMRKDIYDALFVDKDENLKVTDVNKDYILFEDDYITLMSVKGQLDEDNFNYKLTLMKIS